MGLYLADFETKTKQAVKGFWKERSRASKKQEANGKADQGARSAVTGGKNMDGFVSLIQEITLGNGLTDDTIHLNRKALTLPGFFRPTKLWDMIIEWKRTRCCVGVQVTSRTLLWQQHEQPSRGSHWHSTRLLDGLPRTSLWRYS